MENLHNEIEQIKIELNDIKQNQKRIIDRIKPIVKEQVDLLLEEKQLDKLIASKIREGVKNNFKEYIEAVIKNITKTTVKKFKSELNLAKKLAYSTDKEIQHALMKSSCSLEEHDIFINRMNKLFDKVENKIDELPLNKVLKINYVEE